MTRITRRNGIPQARQKNSPRRCECIIPRAPPADCIEEEPFIGPARARPHEGRLELFPRLSPQRGKSPRRTATKFEWNFGDEATVGNVIRQAEGEGTGVTHMNALTARVFFA